MAPRRERTGRAVPRVAAGRDFPPGCTAEERAAWTEMADLLDRERAVAEAPSPAGKERRRGFLLRAGIEWPPRDIDWMDGKTPEDMAAQGRHLEAACRALEGVEEAERLRLLRRVAAVAQSPAFLSACGKWGESCAWFLAHHP